jgi:hypothetical protein
MYPLELALGIGELALLDLRGKWNKYAAQDDGDDENDYGEFYEGEAGSLCTEGKLTTTHGNNLICSQLCR